MNPPIKGMTARPFGEDYMVAAWIALVRATLEQVDAREAFEKETGIDIHDIVLSRGINAMIDEATGYTKQAIVKWADWVTEDLWGVEES